jgi:hypothetical protein
MWKSESLSRVCIDLRGCLITVSRVLTPVTRITIAKVSVPRTWNVIAGSISAQPSDKWSTGGGGQAMGHDSNGDVDHVRR